MSRSSFARCYTLHLRSSLCLHCADPIFYAAVPTTPVQRRFPVQNCRFPAWPYVLDSTESAWSILPSASAPISQNSAHLPVIQNVMLRSPFCTSRYMHVTTLARKYSIIKKKLYLWSINYEPHTSRRHIGGKVRGYRLKNGWTQTELAARMQVVGCDLSREIIARIESGFRQTSVFEIDKFVEVSGITYNDLFAQ